MSKPLIILGSSRSEGDTKSLIESVFAEYEIDLVDLNSYQIGYYTYDHQHQGDDFLPLMEKVVDYEMIIFATPVYWYSMSAVMKTFFDRMTDLVEIRKDLGRALAGKKLFLLSCSNDGKAPEGFVVPFRKTAGYLDMEFGGAFHGSGQNGLNESKKEEANAFISLVYPQNVDKPVD